MDGLDLGLRTAIENGNCILFLGAGIGANTKLSDGKKSPDGKTLAEDIAKKFSIDISGNPELPKVAGVAELRNSRTDLILFLKERFSDIEPDESLLWLFKQRWAAIYTTNYDAVIQRAYEIIPNPPQKPKTITLDPEIVDYDPRFEIPIYHIHGALFGYQDPKIVITEDDYTKFREKRRMLFQLMKIKFLTSPVLYIGYSNQDSNWKTLISEMSQDFYPSELPRSYRISPNTDSLDTELLEAKNTITFDYTYQAFFELASATIDSSSHSSRQYLDIKKNVPTDLIDIFNNNQAPVARLINSWDYVNQALFHETPNIKPFLRGDRPNWGLIGSGDVFEHDIEEELFLDLIDFATTTSNHPEVIILLGPAGYGTTTLLMTLAAKLVNEKVGPVFYLKPGSPVLEGDVEFASNVFEGKKGKTFIFIDDASRYASKINTIMQRLNDIKSPTMLVLGSRLNEWRQSHGKLNVKEYIIDSLSDPEISRLLGLLKKHRELGVLEPLSSELQLATIKGKLGKELLVTMREITEGKSFDAIIDSEYHNINSEISRHYYLAVCCFYQHGVFARDELLSEVLNIQFADLYEKIGDSTEGVVFSTCINEASGCYASRARHRIIAAIVWERCSLSTEKDELLRNIISKLNLNYGVDKNVFEDIIKSDHIIDQINTLDGKIQFFEKAINKDPNSPYVKQHYSRMLLREGKNSLALSIIGDAIKENPKVRVLYHTEGLILMDTALSAESPNIARSRFAQSEQSFKKGIALYSKDEYCYQGLAQLYLGWAKRAPTPEESTEFVTKAEGIIGEGLGVVRVKSSLWIESSNIQKYLGDEPSRLALLEKAVKETPGSIVPRYLLGKQYRIKERFQDAINVLHPVIMDHAEEFRSFVEYAISLAILKKSYDESIAILQLSTLYGYSDPRFIATLGGMLFMNKKFPEAQLVFSESLKHNFTGSELNEIQFKPWDLNNYPSSLRLPGKVIANKAGFSLIDTKGYQQFLCPGSKYDGLIMREGINISFQPVFSAKGSLAITPELINS